MTVWTVVRAWDDGVDEETMVFSTKEKVCKWLHDEIEYLAHREVEARPEIADIFENACEKYLKELHEAFSQDSNTFCIKWVFNRWLVCKAEVDEWE